MLQSCGCRTEAPNSETPNLDLSEMITLSPKKPETSLRGKPLPGRNLASSASVDTQTARAQDFGYRVVTIVT